MRFDLDTQPSAITAQNNGSIPVSVILNPSFGRPGAYVYPTDSYDLLRLLEIGTDLPSPVIDSFMGAVFACDNAHLPGVDLSDDVLKAIGYSLAY